MRQQAGRDETGDCAYTRVNALTAENLAYLYWRLARSSSSLFCRTMSHHHHHRSLRISLRCWLPRDFLLPLFLLGFLLVVLGFSLSRFATCFLLASFSSLCQTVVKPRPAPCTNHTTPVCTAAVQQYCSLLAIFVHGGILSCAFPFQLLCVYFRGVQAPRGW